jgi:hypothetical protein
MREARRALAFAMFAVLLSGAAEARIIDFSGFSWFVKNSGKGRLAPGPNYFSDLPENVWVDAAGRLHMKITRKGNRWSCAEVIANTNVGYGTYRFYIESPVATFDRNVVVGLFTWSDNPDYNYREIDVEFSRWGNANALNGQYVVQPYYDASGMYRFEMPSMPQSTHAFTWSPGLVNFSSLRGFLSAPVTPEDVIQSWSGTANVPVPGDENPRINLWLMDGKRPSNGAEVELIVNRVEFIPAQ